MTFRVIFFTPLVFSGESGVGVKATIGEGERLLATLVRDTDEEERVRRRGAWGRAWSVVDCRSCVGAVRGESRTDIAFFTRRLY